jgi:hypothetical protein
MPDAITLEPRYDVFISYTKLDQAAARTVLHLLRAFGQRVFLDEEGIAAGQLWEPAIREAAAQVKTLILIWSRNATASAYIPQELQMVPKECVVLPIMLDGAALPEGVKDHHGLRGLQVHERILARATALTKQKLPRSRVVSQILEELKEDGYDLTAEQRNAVALVVFRGLGGAALGWWALQWLGSRFRDLVTSPAVLGVTSSVASLAFVSGYLLSDKAAAREVPKPLERVEVTPTCTNQEQALKGLTQDVASCEKRLDGATKEIASCKSSRTDKTDRCTGFRNKLDEVEQGLASCSDALHSGRQAADAAQQEARRYEQERAALQTSLDRAVAAREEAQRAAKTAIAALSDCQARCQKLEPTRAPNNLLKGTTVLSPELQKAVLQGLHDAAILKVAPAASDASVAPSTLQ